MGFFTFFKLLQLVQIAQNPQIIQVNPFKAGNSSYRYQSIDLLPESTDWFLYDRIIGLKRLRLVITYYHMDILAQQTTATS